MLYLARQAALQLSFHGDRLSAASLRSSIISDQIKHSVTDMPTYRAFVDREDVMYAYVSHSPQKTTYKRLVGGCTPDRVLS